MTAAGKVQKYKLRELAQSLVSARDGVLAAAPDGEPSEGSAS